MAEQQENDINKETIDHSLAESIDQASDLNTSSTEIEVLKLEIESWKDKYMRLYSEFENFRRRSAKEKTDLIQNASEQVILSLLPIADDIDRARLNLADIKEIDTIKEGNELIFNKFFKILESKGLKSMSSKGEFFDPEKHEAITQTPAPDEDMKGKVIDEIEKGYFLHDKLIRVAKVVIGS